MNKLFPLMALALLVLVGCAKEETIPVNQQSEETNGTTNVLTLEGDNWIWNALALDELISTHSNSGAISNRGNSAHTHGNIHDFGGSGLTTFSGTQNNGGSHGSAEIQFSAMGGNLHIKLETSSVVILGADENEAVYGGLITEVIENTLPSPPPPPPGFPPPACAKFELGTYVYFVVKDNGQGHNDAPDQYRGVVYSRCTALADGGESFPWFFFGWIDVADEADKIKVNN
jgi:hypothetical protein